MTSASTFALRFISGKYQGGEFPLPASGEVVIGRSSELDMVLVEDMVSRRHAKISVSVEGIYLEDLGSTNGSFVNGERVTRSKLSEGDRILIGTSIIKLVPTEKAVKPADAQAHLNHVAEKRSSNVRTMTGSIAEIPLPDLLQLFSASKKTGTLVVTTASDVGKIFLEKGQIVYATINDSDNNSPEKCFYRILTWDDGTFDMESATELEEFPLRIELPMEHLLMEAMRHMDEAKRLADAALPAAAALTLASPMTSALTALDEVHLSILQLAWNLPTVADVLEQSPHPDLDTNRVLIKLRDQGYLVVS